LHKILISRKVTNVQYLKEYSCLGAFLKKNVEMRALTWSSYTSCNKLLVMFSLECEMLWFSSFDCTIETFTLARRADL